MSILLPLKSVEAAAATYQYGGKDYSVDQIMSMKSPPSGYTPQVGLDSCSNRLEKSTGISGNAFNLIKLTEGGYNGMAIRSKGSGTWDIGKYSVNETHLKVLSQYMSPFDIRWNDCANGVASAFVLFPFYEASKKVAVREIVKNQDPYKAIEKALYELAGYNSQTEVIRRQYAKKLAWMLLRSIYEGDETRLWK
ncbi:hypothetical protein V6259_18055 [Marinomonas sp. TI.3.20]|uniref:hypothetical protein n=1 Tax=Marinomonas sp. TI.3.20 TaxID=3121296 RepID=UPI00311FA67E